MALPYAFSSEGTVKHVAPTAVGEFGYFQGSGETGEIILPPGTSYRIDKVNTGVYAGKIIVVYAAQVLPYDPKELRRAHQRLGVVEECCAFYAHQPQRSCHVRAGGQALPTGHLENTPLTLSLQSTHWIIMYK